MTTARCKIVDLDVTRYYHCISRCVRGAFLCGPGFEHRKQWIENRIELLASCYAVSVAGFSVMDNHMHLLLRVDPDEALAWSDEEVLRRWLTVHPPRGLDLDNEDEFQAWMEKLPRRKKKIARYRKNLASLSSFMKDLKEPLARMANREDGVTGAFWEGRFQSIAVLDEEAILATCAYIDLNPVAAGIATVPETSQHTSVRQRVNHFKRKGKLGALKSAKQGSLAASKTIGNTEQDHWLLPFEDRRPHTHSKPSSNREGMLEKFTLGNYLVLVEYTGRMFRQGKAQISDRIKQVFERLGTSVAFWTDHVKKMLTAKKLRGRCFAGSQNGIPESVQERSSTRMINLSPQIPAG